MADQRLKAGEWGEKIAEKLLRRKGYRILGRRVRVGPHDEIDLVARDGQVLVIVEVKARKSEAFGRPEAAVDVRKRQALSRAAVHYVQRLGNPAVCLRFDVVEVVGEEGESEPDVRHIENAFSLDRRFRLPF